MLELINNTNWAVGLYAGWNENRESQITCVLKTGYSFDSNGSIKPLESQPQIIDADQYYSEPHLSSLEEVNEIAPFKFGSETYLFGTAHPEINKSAMEVEYSIIFNDGKSWSKRLRVTGKRSWNKILLGYVMSKPQPLTATTLQYENSYGGCNPEDDKEFFSYNPIGKGYNKASGWSVMNLELPSIEIGPKFLKSPPQQQIPAGFAPLPVHWEPRKKEVGELHSAQEEQGGCPYTSKAKTTLHNVAPVDQRFPLPFVGGERILLKGFFDETTSQRNIELVVPKLNFDISLVIENTKTQLNSVFDTLIINTDKFEFYTLSRIGIRWDTFDNRNGWLNITEKKSNLNSKSDEKVSNFG